MAIHEDIRSYNAAQSAGDKRICDALSKAIDRHLPGAECKIWHRHPVWFLDGNPVVGYSKLKDCVRLLFWSGQSFDEPGLAPEGTFKAAEARYTSADQYPSGEAHVDAHADVLISGGWLDGQSLVSAAGSSSSRRLTGWAAMRVRTLRR